MILKRQCVNGYAFFVSDSGVDIDEAINHMVISLNKTLDAAAECDSVGAWSQAASFVGHAAGVLGR